MYNHIKLLFPMIILASLSIAMMDIDNGLPKINNFQVSTIPILNNALAQEDTDEDAETAEEDAETAEEDAETAEEDTAGEEGLTPTATPTPGGTTSITVSRIIEGNASMLTSNLPLIKRIIVSDISDVEALAPLNVNQTLRENAQIIDEIDNTTQSVSRSATIKSVVSSELQQAISTLNAVGGNGTLRFAVDNQAQCTPAPVPGNGGPAAATSPTCQFTIRIHQ